MATKKKYADVPMIKSTDPEGHLEILSTGNTTTFCEEGVLVTNNQTNVITWNSGSITHLNFLNKNLMIMYDDNTGIITLTETESDKNIWLDINIAINKIKEDGLTIEGLEMIVNAENNNKDIQEGDNKND